MSFTRVCPICKSTFTHTNKLNQQRVNLTCGDECHGKQRMERQRERRLKAHRLELRRKLREQAKHEPLLPGILSKSIRSPRSLSNAKRGTRGGGRLTRRGGTGSRIKTRARMRRKHASKR